MREIGNYYQLPQYYCELFSKILGFRGVYFITIFHDKSNVQYFCENLHAMLIGSVNNKY